MSLSKYPTEFVDAVKQKDCSKVDSILDNGQIDINILDDIWGVHFIDWPLTPLMYTAWKGDTEMTVLFLKYSADVNKRDAHGHTALHNASRNGHFMTIVVLIRGGANVNLTDEADGKTPLHYAAENGHTEAVAALIQGAADVESCNKYGGTALHYAAWKGHTQTVFALIQGHANVNKTTITNNTTALHLASAEGHTDTVRKLLQYGANASLIDGNHETALHRAKKENHHNCMDTLQQHITEKGNNSHQSGRMPKQVHNPILASGGYTPALVPAFCSQNMSQIYVPQQLPHSTLPSMYAVPYKKINDPNQYIPLPDSILGQFQPPTNAITGRPTEKELDTLSASIGTEWYRLALHLGLSNAQTQQLQMSYHYDARRQIYQMLLLWRGTVQEKTEEERCGMMRRSLIEVNRRDLSQTI